MPLARLSSKSQIVLPAKIRREAGIAPGDLLEITKENNSIVIRKAPTSFVDALQQCSSHIWQNYATELEKMRSEWD